MIVLSLNLFRFVTTATCPSYSVFTLTNVEQMVLLTKGVRYALRPVLAANKPDWLLQHHDGALPALMHGEVTVSDPLKIAEYIEQKYPNNPLNRLGSLSYQEVLERSAQFFPALSAYITNKDESLEEERKAAFDRQLDILDEIMRSTPGKFFGGIDMTLADLYLIPQLFHAMVAEGHFKDRSFYTIGTDPDRPALEGYMSRVMDLKEFNDKNVRYTVDAVVYGWKVRRGDA